MPMNNNNLNGFTYYPNQNILQRDNITALQYPYGNYFMQTPNQNNNLFLKCRPVSSKEQARSSQIDLDGSLWVFTDVGNNKIYTKQITPDGTAKFNTYVLTEEKDQNDGMLNSSNFVTKEEFNNTIQQILAAIKPTEDEKANSVKPSNF